MDSPGLTYKMFLWSKSQGLNNWTTRTQKLMEDLNLTDIQQVSNSMIWHSLVADEFTSWYENLHNPPANLEKWRQACTIQTI